MEWKVTGRMHRAIQALLTLAVILCALFLGFSRLLYPEFIGAFRTFTLASVVLIHLRIRPKWVDVLLIALIAALFITVRFYMFHYPPRIMAGLSFSGLSSFVVIVVRSIWDPERRLLLYAWVPAASFVFTDHFGSRVHDWIANAHPKTLDLYLLSFDGSLRVQPAFIVGQYCARLPWLHNAAVLAYVGLAIPMALVYAGLLARFKEGAFPSILAFLITGPIGFLCYNLFPACGPHYVFKQAFPFHPLPVALISQLAFEPAAFSGWRNAMPSLHLAWTLLAWWYSKGLSWIERLIAFVFLALTVVATLGTGEHWFVDLIVAFPYALMIYAICSYPVSWKDPRRGTALVLGLGGTLGWMAMLRYGAELFWTSPIVPWALAAATVALVLLRQSKLDAVAHLEKLAAAAHSAPALFPGERAPDLVGRVRA